MSYVDRMCVRLLWPTLLPLAGSLLAAVMAQALSNLPAQLGGAPAWPELPGIVAEGGALASAVYGATRLFRLLRWRQGRADSCYVCTCLLGPERQGHRGEYRRCLGCGMTHSV